MRAKTIAALGGAALGMAALGLSGGLALAQEEDKPLERVLGGWNASMDDYPWQVALIKNEGNSVWADQYCGGSVIAPRWVLTAAHCMFKTVTVDGVETRAPRLPTDILVYWSEADLDAGGPLEAVSRIIVHEGYSDGTSANDIALLELATPIGAEPIALAAPAQAAALERAGAIATVSGWGVYHPVRTDKVTGVITDALTDAVIDPARAMEHQYPTLLQAVTVPVADLDACRAAYSPSRSIDESVVCAGALNEGYDACEGDSGGPLVVTDAEGRRVQIGVVSWGLHCLHPDDFGNPTTGYYNFYTRVTAFSDWIAEQSGVGAASDEPVDVVFDSPFDSVFDTAAVPAYFTAFDAYNRLSLVAGSVDATPAMTINAGGQESASSLKADCAGRIAQRADVAVLYQGDGRPLHISVASEKDTTLAVLTPGGQVICNDDVVLGDKNPSVRLDAPASGEYRIWVGTYYEESPLPPSKLYFSDVAAKFAD